jgi:hypothetical protein
MAVGGRPTRTVRRVVGATFAAGLAFGLRDALQTEPDAPIVVIDEAQEPPPPGPLTLYFHPDVPEATLVLLR